VRQTLDPHKGLMITAYTFWWHSPWFKGTILCLYCLWSGCGYVLAWKACTY